MQQKTRVPIKISVLGQSPVRASATAQVLLASLVLVVLPAKAKDSLQETPDSLFNLSIEQLANITLVTAASGFEQSIKNAPATVTVIHKEEWQAMGARTLGQVIETVPGMHVTKSKVYGSNEQYTARGINGDFGQHIKLLIDGESFEFMQNGGIFNGFHMPLSIFRRIEVVKGPGSAIYGADAFAGVINLVTEKADRETSTLGTRMGTFASWDVFGLHTSVSENSSWVFGFELMKSDDDKNRIVTSDLQSILDQSSPTNASEAPGPLDNHYQVLTLLAKWSTDSVKLHYWTWRNFDAGTGAGLAQALDSGGKTQSLFEQFSTQFFLGEWMGNDELTLTLGYKRQKSDAFYTLFPAGTVLPIDSDGNANFSRPVGHTLFVDGYISSPSSSGYTGFAKMTHLFPLGSNHLFRWELGYEENTFNTQESRNFGPGVLTGNETVVDGPPIEVTNKAYLYVPPKIRHFNYLSLQDVWQITKDIQLTLGIRHDDYSDFGSTTNTRMGLIWNTTDRIRFRLFSGTAFRAPSYNDLYLQNNPVAVGNPNLEPESISTLETGFATELLLSPNLSLSLNLFRYEALDLIAYTPIPGRQVTEANNNGDHYGRGGELIAHWKPTPSIVINANYSYVDSEDEYGNKTPDIPLNQAFAALNWRIDKHWNWNLHAKWVANRKRAPIDASYPNTRENIDDYTWWATKIAYTNLMPGLEVGLTVDNLFDEDAREPSNGLIADDYPLAGRQWMLETKYEF